MGTRDPSLVLEEKDLIVVQEANRQKLNPTMFDLAIYTHNVQRSIGDEIFEKAQHGFGFK